METLCYLSLMCSSSNEYKKATEIDKISVVFVNNIIYNVVKNNSFILLRMLKLIFL